MSDLLDHLWAADVKAKCPMCAWTYNLVDEEEWKIAMGPGGALEAAVEAREQGLVRFIGVTGHGTRVAERHLQSLEQFPFDSVLLPYNYTMMSQPDYAADFERLYEVCRTRGVAARWGACSTTACGRT